MSKYYATITGPDGKEMKVMVIPVRQDEAPNPPEHAEGNRPVAVVNPSNSASGSSNQEEVAQPSSSLKSQPSPPRESPAPPAAVANPTPQKNVKQRRKQQRLNGILEKLAQKKGGSDQSPSSSSSPSTSSPEPIVENAIPKTEPVKSPAAQPKKNGDLQINKNFGIKLGDKGSGQIKILGKITEVPVQGPSTLKSESDDDQPPALEKASPPRSPSPPQLDYLSDRSRSPSPGATKPEKLRQSALKKTAPVSSQPESQGKSPAQKNGKPGLLGRGIPIGNLGNVVASVSVPNRRLSNGNQPKTTPTRQVSATPPKRGPRPAPIQVQTTPKTPSPVKTPQPSSTAVPSSSPLTTPTTSQSSFKPINMAGRTIIAPNMVKSLVSPKLASNGKQPIPSPTNFKPKSPDVPNNRPTQRTASSGNNIQRAASSSKPNPASVRPSSRPNIRPPPPPPVAATRGPAPPPPTLPTFQPRAATPVSSFVASQTVNVNTQQRSLATMPHRIISRPVGRPPLNSYPVRAQTKPRQQQHSQPALDPNLVDIVKVRPAKKSGHHKYPPPTLVEGGISKFGANIKTIKMADGSTCGIKVQSQSLYQKVNITNSKLREIKRGLADNLNTEHLTQLEKKKKVSQQFAEKAMKQANNQSNNLVPVTVDRRKSSPPHSSKGISSGAPTLAPKATTPIKGNLLSRFPTVGTAKLKTSGTTPQKHGNRKHKAETKTEKVEDGCRRCCPAPKSAPSKPIVDLPPSGQNLVLSPENQMLVRKYLDKHPGQKMDFALCPVQKNMVIDPSFPLVKVGDNQFQLIPKEIMEKQQKAQRQIIPKNRTLAPLQPKPDQSDSNGSQNGSEEEGSAESNVSSDDKRIEKKNLFVWKEAEITNEEGHM
ncbi:Oidioi.mRNA.OKI2018_I69.chr1.g1845.t1.cds [Oikopleura dioica]|uniref:Oidioi.mRNA.OKI2018_I69.chr1.g1845.t1.cds n=1 Tax=Oikopleura dioica TaxID=34765 RepID=A0ABN7SSN0_OIKDI|nr:Oidioi.mRNA.OKI2018_I69.chr1.g1845.t1.cds [Oikopleura dioica]